MAAGWVKERIEEIPDAVLVYNGEQSVFVQGMISLRKWESALKD